MSTISPVANTDRLAPSASPFSQMPVISLNCREIGCGCLYATSEFANSIFNEDSRLRIGTCRGNKLNTSHSTVLVHNEGTHPICRKGLKMTEHSNARRGKRSPGSKRESSKRVHRSGSTRRRSHRSTSTPATAVLPPQEARGRDTRSRRGVAHKEVQVTDALQQLLVARYARYSSDSRRKTSVLDQLEMCRRWLEERGGTRREDLAFSERGVSGTVPKAGFDLLLDAVARSGRLRCR